MSKEAPRGGRSEARHRARNWREYDGAWLPVEPDRPALPRLGLAEN